MPVSHRLPDMSPIEVNESIPAGGSKTWLFFDEEDKVFNVKRIYVEFSTGVATSNVDVQIIYPGGFIDTVERVISDVIQIKRDIDIYVGSGTKLQVSCINDDTANAHTITILINAVRVR